MFRLESSHHFYQSPDDNALSSVHEKKHERFIPFLRRQTESLGSDEGVLIIDQVEQLLTLYRGKHNIIIAGDPGAGKTTTGEGLRTLATERGWPHSHEINMLYFDEFEQQYRREKNIPKSIPFAKWSKEQRDDWSAFLTDKVIQTKNATKYHGKEELSPNELPLNIIELPCVNTPINGTFDGRLTGQEVMRELGKNRKENDYIFIFIVAVPAIFHIASTLRDIALISKNDYDLKKSALDLHYNIGTPRNEDKKSRQLCDFYKHSAPSLLVRAYNDLANQDARKYYQEKFGKLESEHSQSHLDIIMRETLNMRRREIEMVLKDIPGLNEDEKNLMLARTLHARQWILDPKYGLGQPDNSHYLIAINISIF